MADANPEFERIRGYLQTQAAKHQIDEIERRVQDGVDALHAAARSCDQSTVASNPPGEEWSPLACLTHSVGSNSAVARQILHVALTGELPAHEEAVMAADGSGPLSGSKQNDPEQLIASHTEAIDSLYAHVREADPQANLEVLWKHPFFGDLNWREWFLFLRIHCFDHARQLEAMRDAFAKA